jgi:uracil-DNA glycosylase
VCDGDNLTWHAADGAVGGSAPRLMPDVSQRTLNRDNRKTLAYQALVKARKECRACVGLVNPSVCHAGEFDCGEIGAWSTWQGNLDAPLMVVGQDWGDDAWFVREGGKTTSTSVTNKTLIKLLESVGFEIPLARDSTGRGALFFTNAILCLKQGGAQGRVQAQWFENCGGQFLRPLIELVQPRVVVGLGERAYAAVVSAYGLKPGNFRADVESAAPVQLSTGIVAFAVYHCGARILNTHRALDAQLRDWVRIRSFLTSPAG